MNLCLGNEHFSNHFKNNSLLLLLLYVFFFLTKGHLLLLSSKPMRTSYPGGFQFFGCIKANVCDTEESVHLVLYKDSGMGLKSVPHQIDCWSPGAEELSGCRGLT